MPQQMLVHQGGQINNVQLFTGVRIAEMSQLQNCSENEKRRKSQGVGGMCTKNGNYCEKEKVRGVSG